MKQTRISARSLHRCGHSLLSSLLLLSALGLLAQLQHPVQVGHAQMLAPAAGSNPIDTENQQPGSSGWQFDQDSTGAPLEASNHQIEGYASLTSVNQGGQISFMVSLSSAAQFQMQIYRMGYYPTGTNPDGTACSGPCGGRLMQTVGPLNGTTQPTCPIVTTTTNFGLTECNWTPAYTLTVPTTWTTGIYLAKLKRLDTSLEQYITFVVRSDGAAADLVLSEDVTTWQAYNYWAGAGNHGNGYDLYGEINDITDNTVGNTRAYAVSFDRPYHDSGEIDGAGQFFLWDYPMVRWLEAKGYNVTYATDIDLDTKPDLLTGRKALINTGHDEYYSANMRSNVQSYITAGARVGFFSANNIYYHVTIASNAAGQTDRRVICYKDTSLDPTTTLWRVQNLPENAIVGVMQNGVANDRPYLVYDASSWIYAGTGLVNYSGKVVTSGAGQNAISGIIGYEFDERAGNVSTLSSYVQYDPPGLQQVGHSAVPASDNGVAAYSDATVYTASSGATVFGAGTIQWSWGLDNGYNTGFCSCNPGYANSASQQITANILNRFISGPTPTPTATGTTTAAPTATATPTSTATPTPTPPPLPAGTYFQEGFESGSLSQWTTGGTGKATVETSVVHSGTYAVGLTNTSGQYTSLQAALAGGAQTLTYTGVYFQLASLATTSTPILEGRDVNGAKVWEVDYDAASKGLDIYFWNGSGTRFDIYSSANLLSANTWYSLEVLANEATSGQGQAWLNGTSIGTVSGDLSVTNPYLHPFLYSEAPTSVYFDDIIVASTYQ